MPFGDYRVLVPQRLADHFQWCPVRQEINAESLAESVRVCVLDSRCVEHFLEARGPVFCSAYRLTIAAPENIFGIAVGNSEQGITDLFRHYVVDASMGLAPANLHAIASLAIDSGGRNSVPLKD